MAALQCEV